MLLVLVCLRGGEAMALWVEEVGLEQSVNEEERDRLAFMDLTDKENVYFRYVL